MRRFEELEVVGDGAFGIVTKCRDKETGEIVAIKKMKKRYSSFEECLQLKEVKSLRKIKHPNVVKLLQVFRENEYLYLVFELMGKSLLKTINERNGYNENEIRCIMAQILTGLNYVHRQGFFHRDMKPDNLLWSDENCMCDMSNNTSNSFSVNITNSCYRMTNELFNGRLLKIADFGLAKEIRSRPPFTEYVATRWYRAPEIILRTENYNSPVDIWACGVIMAELFIARPLFQGNSETDQLYKIFSIIGPLTSKSWPDGVKHANKLGIKLITSTPAIGLASAIPNASKEALNLIGSMLKYDPSKRPSANQALHHPFFNHDAINIEKQISNPSSIECDTLKDNNINQNKSLEKNTNDLNNRYINNNKQYSYIDKGSNHNNKTMEDQEIDNFLAKY